MRHAAAVAEGLHQPVSAPAHRALRRAVLDHASHEHRRIFEPLLHVGVPGGEVAVLGLRRGEHTDHGLRCDLVAALVRRALRPGPPPLVWLTRSGDLEPEDVDLAWLAAARAAYAEAGLALTMVVVTRQGWRDPRSGATHRWQRLRGR